jgi:hypothetical protein
MAQLYETYGPFSLAGENADHLGRPSSDFWEFVEDRHPGISTAIGVYVIAVRKSKAKSLPWYVGMTERGFEGRLSQHRTTFAKIAIASNGGTQELYLLARRKLQADGFIKVSKNKRPGVHFLERRLVDTCLKRNPELLNGQLVNHLKHTVVPGYLNDRGKRSPAAASFNALITGNEKI